MVAEKVVIVTRRAGEKEAVRWESDGSGTFSVEAAEKEKRGTTITLHLAKEFYGDKAEENFTDGRPEQGGLPGEGGRRPGMTGRRAKASAPRPSKIGRASCRERV